jgi:iron complex outermembrane recepter protein
MFSVTPSFVNHSSIKSRPAMLALAISALSSVAYAQQPAALDVEEIVVTGSREATLRAETPASVSVIGSQTIEYVKPSHPSEIMNRIPGVTVQQTNGEGHLTGIRQPIGTSPVYLFLEDGVPVRASGFFNHNAMYEINMPMSSGIEVTRGPGTALQGSDAIGGIVNVLTRAPS